jgi:uncharacterized protein (TIGR03437 family)
VYKKATQRIAIATVLAAGLQLATGLHAQTGVAPGTQSGPRRDWRRVGNAAIDKSLAGLATGPVNRVWYSAAGTLMIQTANGRVFETKDSENWQAVRAIVPESQASTAAVRLPENNARVRGAIGAPAIAYAFGKFVYRSETGGANWDNLTAFRNISILGDDIRDLAVSPSNPEEIVVAGGNGVFRSLDAGKTWSGLNQSLPNLPAARLLALPNADRGVRLGLAQAVNGQTTWSAVEWNPGQKQAWRVADLADLDSEMQMLQSYKQRFGAGFRAIGAAGDSIYLGTSDGQIFSSTDRGATWITRPLGLEAADVERFWIDPSDSRTVVAVLGTRQRDPLSPLPAVHVVHTTNGGLDWESMTGDLPDVGVHGITADRTTNAVYLATDRGVFMSYRDLRVLGADPQWVRVDGLPAAVRDVKLDSQGNQLWAAVDGFGVYSTLAPHRARDPRVVSTADLVARAISPGSLISILGRRVQTARAGDLQVPVLDSDENESHLQVPFEARGDSLSLAFESPTGPMTMPVQLEAASPGIFVNREDGSPMLLDGESGVMLDAMNPARSRGRIQILMTGLGRVTPDWPTGLAGPVENPPQVVAPVKAYLDRQPVEVSRAVLAPFIGFYLVEIEIPKIVNYGAAELYIEAGGKASNRVRVYIQP